MVLGETPGLGRSWIVALAYPSTTQVFHTVTMLSIVLVIPTPQHPSQWTIGHITTVDAWVSPKATVAMHIRMLFGVWLIFGLFTDDNASNLHIRQLQTTSDVMPEAKDRGFLAVTDIDPEPLEAIVLAADGRVLEAFRYPPILR